MLAPGQIIEDKYRIVRLIGEGGMGAVFEGENTRIHRRVAIKLLHVGIAQNQDIVARFEREAQAAGRIGSDHIVEVLDLGNLPQGERFMVMEYLDGEHLGSRIQARGRLEPREATAIMIQLLEGLGAAHAAGIIHRDLKPENVFLVRPRKGQSDFVKILDFGISKFSALGGDNSFSMTRTGAVMGTPYYMSPEQARGSKHTDVRSDLYGVGVILYEAVTGTVPFRADTFNELIFKIALETPAPPQQLVPSLDPAFAQIVCKAMAREPDARFQSANEFSEALIEWSAASDRAHGAHANSPAMHGGLVGSVGHSIAGQAGSTVTTPHPAAGAGAAAESMPRVPAEPGVAEVNIAQNAATPEPWSHDGADSGAATADRRRARRSQTRRFVALAAGGLSLGSLIAVAAVKLLRPPPAGGGPNAPNSEQLGLVVPGTLSGDPSPAHSAGPSSAHSAGPSSARSAEPSSAPSMAPQAGLGHSASAEVDVPTLDSSAQRKSDPSPTPTASAAAARRNNAPGPLPATRPKPTTSPAPGQPASPQHTPNLGSQQAGASPGGGSTSPPASTGRRIRTEL